MSYFQLIQFSFQELVGSSIPPCDTVSIKKARPTDLLEKRKPLRCSSLNVCVKWYCESSVAVKMWDSIDFTGIFIKTQASRPAPTPHTPMLKLWSSSIAEWLCVCGGENNFICVYVTAASDVYVYFFRPADSEGSLQVENVRLFVFNSRGGECLLEYSEDWIQSVRLLHIYSSFHKVWLHGAVTS